MTPQTVLDTQAVLDWLYFADPACTHWEDARRDGRWQWVATTAMRDELAHVLTRGLPGGDRRPGAANVLAHFDERATVLAAPSALPWGVPRCTDPDDQKFIDFAVSLGVRWLVSRDRAVLKLRRPVERLGPAIVTPAHWRPAALPDGASTPPGPDRPAPNVAASSAPGPA